MNDTCDGVVLSSSFSVNRTSLPPGSLGFVATIRMSPAMLTVRPITVVPSVLV